MGLLDPLNLVYLGSLGVLVLVYLRARSRPTLDVSSLILFDEVPAPVASARLLRVDLMFWLELLALGALSLAAAGPYLRMPAPPDHIRRHALVFDLGAAMGARDANGTRLDQARSDAFAMLAQAPSGDEFSVIGYALEARVVHAPSANRDSIRESAAALKPLDTPARASALAAALMRARDADTIDLYADRMPPQDLAGSAQVQGRLRFHRVGTRADNLAIVSLDPGVVRSSRGSCVLRNFSPRPRLCDLQIDCAGARVLRAAVMLDPDAQAVIPFGPLQSGGLVSARIENDDSLAADNQRWAYAQTDEPEKALVISPDAGVRDDLARVLLAVNQNFLVTAIEPGKFKPADQPPDISLVVMHDFYDSWVKAPSRLYIYPPASGAGFQLQSAVVSAELRDRAGAGDFSRPLQLGAARVLSIAPWMDVTGSGVAAGAGDLISIPLAALGRDSEGVVGVIAFDIRDHLLLDPDRLDALILTVDLVKRLTAPESLQIVETGSYVTVPAAGAATIVSPDGASQRVSADSYGRVRFRAEQAGRYGIESDGPSAAVFANYFDAAESDLNTASPAAAEPAPRAPARASAPGSIDLRPLEAILVGLALIAFLIESAIILRAVTGWRWRNV